MHNTMIRNCGSIFSFQKSFIWGFVVGVLVSLDTVNIRYIGYSFKLNVFLFFLLGLVVLLKGFVIKLPRYFFLVMIFLAFSFCSMVFSDAYLGGALYVAYTFITIYLLVIVVYELSKDSPDVFLKGFVSSLVFQVFFAAILVVIGVHDRAQFFYYEPSYFSLALIPLFVLFSLNAVSANFFRLSNFIILLSILSFLAFSKSANGLLALFLSFFFVTFLAFFVFDVNRKRYVFLSIIAIAFLLIFLAVPALVFLGAYEGDDLLLSSLRKLVFSSDKLDFLTGRAGNRINRIILALDVFKDNVFLGVGPGNYINYIEAIDHDLYDVPSWLSPYGLPAINMYLEVAATTGLLGLVTFLFVLGYVVFGSASVASLRFSREYLVVFVSIIVFLLAINFESSYLRLYFWAWVGILFSMKRKGFEGKQGILHPYVK